MLKRLFAVTCAVVMLCALPAEARDDLAGTWIWSVEGRNVFVLELVEGAAGLEGSMQRPAVVELAPGASGLVVTRVQTPVTTYDLSAGGEAAGGHVLRYEAADPDDSRTYVLWAGDAGEAVLAISPEPGAWSVPLHRPRPATAVFTEWRPGETFSVGTARDASNAEITTMFEADQAARMSSGEVDWSVVAVEDAERRARAREMLDAGELNSADDYYHAAFIFQHGSEADDYLLAHVLAMTAASKGHARAPWIAAATLDRYLHNIGRAQIYGTQYQYPPGGGEVTQGDYDRDLLPDSLRSAAGVPPLNSQDEQRQHMQQRLDQSSTGR